MSTVRLIKQNSKVELPRSNKPKQPSKRDIHIGEVEEDDRPVIISLERINGFYICRSEDDPPLTC